MEELKVFIGFHVRFLKDCIKKGLLKEENKQLLTEYRNKLIDMASVLNKDGAVKLNLTELITLRFKEEFGIR